MEVTKKVYKDQKERFRISGVDNKYNKEFIPDYYRETNRIRILQGLNLLYKDYKDTEDYYYREEKSDEEYQA